MQIHEIQPIRKKKSKKKIGRGGKKGTYSGKGIKGQSARAGRKFQPAIREVIKRYAKLKGYRRKAKEKLEVQVNLEILEKKFKTGEKITPEVLIKQNIISKIKGKRPSVKILGKGELKKKLIVIHCKVSAEAKKKIEKVGGAVK